MPDPIPFSEGQLYPHWAALSSAIAPGLSCSNGGVALRAEAIGEAIIAAWTGSATRRAFRLRGEPMVVAPFRPIRDDFDAWIGYREVYGLQDRSKRKYSFSSADLTLFFAPKGQELFEQILRAEWSGPINVASEWIYRPNNAAHPHWQIDVAESLRADPELKAARELLTTSGPKEFGAEPVSSMRDPPWYDLGRMHFASAMRPWIDSDLAHCPITLDAVRAWTIHTIELLHTELDRL